MGVVYTAMPQKQLVELLPKTFPTIEKERMDRSFRRSLLDYDSWAACSEVMHEPHKDYYAECISGFPREILFVNGENESRISEAKFLRAAQHGSLHVVPKGDHTVFIHQDTCDQAYKAILDFADKIDFSFHRQDKPQS